jgi:uncharacterized glyoxalase superfamily protein PhnB
MHFFVRDVAAATAFYERIGFKVESTSDHFARVAIPGGMTFEFGSYRLTRGYDPAFREPAGAPSNALQFSLASREAVDALYAELTGAGYEGRLAPFDAFWGSRYMEVCDPDGNVIGVHSPRDNAMASRPQI